MTGQFMSALRLLAAAASVLFVASTGGASAASIDAAQKAEIEAIVKAYIVAHPEIVVEALSEYEARQKKAEQSSASAAIARNRAEILSEKGGGVIGNPKGDLTVVEFFDYRCGYCRQARPVIDQLVKSDPNLRFVYKEFPILGPDSLFASRAAMAARLQGPDKYLALHDALMTTKGTLDETSVRLAARQSGLDADKLIRDMDDPSIDATLKVNHGLARELGINGTPSFVIGDNLIPGYAELDQMRAAIEDARKTCKDNC